MGGRISTGNSHISWNRANEILKLQFSRAKFCFSSLSLLKTGAKPTYVFSFKINYGRMKKVLKNHYNTKNRPTKIWGPLNFAHGRNFAPKIILAHDAPYAAHKVSRGELNSKPHGTSCSRHLPIELPPRGRRRRILIPRTEKDIV